jgi:hypothetical protein
VLNAHFRGVEFLSLKFSNYFNHHNTLPIVTMSALNKNLAFTQCILEKMEATLSVGLLEKEAAFAVAEQMVALLVCRFTFLFFFVADLLVLVFFENCHSAWLASGVPMSDTLIQLFRTLDTFVKVNICTNWEALHKDYTFVLELIGPSAAALALDRAWADTHQLLVASAPVENHRSVVETEGGRVEEVVEVEDVVLKVPDAPRPKPGGSKSVPGEWNKLAREKKEAKGKLADEKEEAERKMSAEKGMAEEKEVEEMMDRPLEGKGKGVVREAVGLPEVTTRGSAQRRIKSATFVVDSDEEDKEVLAANPVLRSMSAVSPLKGWKVEVMLPAPQGRHDSQV